MDVVRVCSTSPWAVAAIVLAAAGCTGTDTGPAAAAASKTAPHVLVLSVDGMHGVDLERYIAAKPESTLAMLAKTGVRYTDVSTPFPSDSFPGQLALATGGTPKSTGIYYDLSYDRHLSPPDSDCTKTGAIVDFTEASDVDASREDAGGGLSASALPRARRT